MSRGSKRKHRRRGNFCAGKVPYMSEADARETCVSAYVCPNCGAWHATNSKASEGNNGHPRTERGRP